MAQIYKSIDGFVGNTPIIELTHIRKEFDLQAKIFAKLEYLNPAGSIKDRVAKAMLEAAEQEGRIRPGNVIIEPTSGNTGIALASIGTAKGYRVIIVMPDNMSEERRKLIEACGGEVILTPGAQGIKGAIKKAEELAKEVPDSFIPAQFDNPENTRVHMETTGPEIYSDMDGLVDIFVSGIGTGGTIMGAGKYLKAQNNKIQIIAVEPDTSPVLSKGTSGEHEIQGIGPEFVPELLNTLIYDEILSCSMGEAVAMARVLGKKEGILAGISSGAVLHAAVTLAKRDENKGKNIVTILFDSADRYFSTSLFE